MNKLVNYVKASIAEMKKVTWPTKKQTYQYTMLVVGVSVIIAIFLFSLDIVFGKVISSLVV